MLFTCFSLLFVFSLFVSFSFIYFFLYIFLLNSFCFFCSIYLSIYLTFSLCTLPYVFPCTHNRYKLCKEGSENRKRNAEVTHAATNEQRMEWGTRVSVCAPACVRDTLPSLLHTQHRTDITQTRPHAPVLCLSLLCLWRCCSVLLPLVVSVQKSTHAAPHTAQQTLRGALITMLHTRPHRGRKQKQKIADMENSHRCASVCIRLFYWMHKCPWNSHRHTRA